MLESLLIPLVYTVMIGVSWPVMKHMTKGFSSSTDRDVTTFLGSVLWPVGMSVTAGMLLVKGLKKLLGKITTMSMPVTRPKELFKGVPKPSSILADMVCAHMLQHPEQAKDELYKHTTGKVSIVFRWNRYQKTCQLNLDDRLMTLDALDKAKLIRAGEAAYTLCTEKHRAATVAANEQLALDVIEKLMGLPAPEKTIPINLDSLTKGVKLEPVR